VKQEELQIVNAAPEPEGPPANLPAAQARAWLERYALQIRGRLQKLAKVETRPGRGGAKKQEAAAQLADKLERRLARLMRVSEKLEGQVVREAALAKRLAKSKDPRERAEVVLRALDELPAEIAGQTAAEAGRRAAARLGRGQEDTEV
jgi:hypothetical protein